MTPEVVGGEGGHRRSGGGQSPLLLRKCPTPPWSWSVLRIRGPLKARTPSPAVTRTGRSPGAQRSLAVAGGGGGGRGEDPDQSQTAPGQRVNAKLRKQTTGQM